MQSLLALGWRWSSASESGLGVCQVEREEGHIFGVGAKRAGRGGELLTDLFPDEIKYFIMFAARFRFIWDDLRVQQLYETRPGCDFGEEVEGRPAARWCWPRCRRPSALFVYRFTILGY